MMTAITPLPRYESSSGTPIDGGIGIFWLNSDVLELATERPDFADSALDFRELGLFLEFTLDITEAESSAIVAKDASDWACNE